jgi:EAL domain-containing protein (putative c-di-GMP-specific phosphodiesterase class I)
LFIGGQDTVDAVLMHADLAMYRAKQDGRNALRFFEQGMQVELARRTALESELRRAIELEQFELYYQPQFDRDGTLVAAEALLRWHHPTRGVLAPGEFIAVAEETGLIVPLGQWVLEAACARIAAWEARPAAPARVLAVNVSARQFAQPAFVDGVRHALAVAGADPTRLKLELTESIVLEDVDDALGKMQALKQVGVTFALDDFGTGSSSLSYLTRLPIDQLKIDKSFVDDLPDDRQDAMVAQTIVTMAKGLGLAVVAEGVETDAQWRFLLRHGCDLFQGFRFARPMPAAQLEQVSASRDAALAPSAG